MKSFSQKAVLKFQNFKDNNISKLGEGFLRLGISANIMTFISLIFGILSIYFLFSNYWLFFAFAIMHVLADGFDGVIARVSKTTKFGDYFDYFSDRLVVILIYINIYLVLRDYILLVVLGLYLLTQLIYLVSKKTYPIIFYRSVGLLLMVLYPLFPLPQYLIFCYLLGGAFTVFSLALQLKHYVNKTVRES